MNLKQTMILSSPEPLGSHGEVIVNRPSSASVHHFQRPSLKPLDQSKPNFKWSRPYDQGQSRSPIRLNWENCYKVI